MCGFRMKCASAIAARKRACGHVRERAPGWFASSSGVGVHIWRRLSTAKQRRRLGDATRQHGGDGPPPAGPKRGSACGTPCRAAAGPRGMAYHAQTAAVPERFIVVAARGLTRTQPGRAGMAATARSALGQSLLRRIRANRKCLLRRLEYLHANTKRHPYLVLAKLGSAALGFGYFMTRDWY